jgi:hypothetical protein
LSLLLWRIDWAWDRVVGYGSVLALDRDLYRLYCLGFRGLCLDHGLAGTWEVRWMSQSLIRHA